MDTQNLDDPWSHYTLVIAATPTSFPPQSHGTFSRKPWHLYMKAAAPLHESRGTFT
jgi:hypothetical protein